MKKIIILLSLALVSWGAFAQNSQKIQSSIKIEKSTLASAIIDNYLSMKDALVKEDSKTAASFGKVLFGTFPKFDASELTSQQKNEVAKIIKGATQQAKYIADHSEDIALQRQHFEYLTKSIKELIVLAGSDRPLYQAYCPMYNNNKGGAWLSMSKEISNPYFGSKMLKCGSVQQEISLK